MDKGENAMKSGCLKISVSILLAALTAEATESNVIDVYTDSNRSVLYRTMSSDTLILPIELGAYNADDAKLSVSGINSSKTLVYDGSSNFVVAIPPVTESSENVYDLTLTYFKDGRATFVRTATIGHVASCGTDSATSKLLRNSDPRWKLTGCRAVFQIPFGAQSLTIDSDTYTLDGRAGWFAWMFERSSAAQELLLSSVDEDYNARLIPALISGLIYYIR